MGEGVEKEYGQEAANEKALSTRSALLAFLQSLLPFLSTEGWAEGSLFQRQAGWEGCGAWVRQRRGGGIVSATG